MHAMSFPKAMVITGIKEETTDVKTMTLTAVSGEHVACKGGQFLTFSFLVGGREVRRSYSISSGGRPGEPLAITVKRVENGLFSRWLIDKAQVGDRLECTGVAGLFVMPDAPGFETIFLFAAGIGITPVYALLKDLIAADYPARICLFYSNRNEEAAVFRTALLGLQLAANGRLQIVWLYSDDKQLVKARLTRAFMDELLERYLDDPSKTLCYLCGPSDYRWLVHLLLEEAGVPAANIRQEIFRTDHIPVVQTPPDQGLHFVTLSLAGQHYTFPVQYPSTILRAAQNAGILLPYSCEAGRCSSCAARCTAGKVWMSYNEVLTEKELERGLVLTCTGFPVGGDVRITI